MKVNFSVSGTMEIPDDAVKHYDVAGELYAFEFNNNMYMLQVCLVAESPDGEFDIVHQYDEMHEHNINNLRYDTANFSE